MIATRVSSAHMYKYNGKLDCNCNQHESNTAGLFRRDVLLDIKRFARLLLWYRGICSNTRFTRSIETSL